MPGHPFIARREPRGEGGELGPKICGVDVYGEPAVGEGLAVARDGLARAKVGGFPEQVCERGRIPARLWELPKAAE